MTDPVTLELELTGLDTRDLIVKLFLEVRAANGRCAEHAARTEADLYGDPIHQVQGLKSMVQDHAAYISRARFVSKLALGVLSLTGLANLGALIALIKVIAGS
jgi:hypothetical protein